MTLTKLALAVLGTIGLTAGTVLAVSEPTTPPLPTAVAQVNGGRCPGSTCSTGECTSEGCPFAAKVAAVAACESTCCESKKCSAPPAQSEPIVADVCTDSAACSATNARCGTCLASQACSTATASLFDADGICRKHFVAHESTSACAAKGHVLLTGTNCESCPNSVCTADARCEECPNGTCDASVCESKPAVATKKATRSISLGIGLSTGGPIIHVAAGNNDDTAKEPESACSAASIAGRIALSLMNHQPASSAGACNDGACEVTATACKATSTCATAACPTSACAIDRTAGCSQSDCDSGECDSEAACCSSSLACRCPGCAHCDDQPQAAAAPSILHIRDIIRDASNPEWRPTSKDEVVQKYFAATPGLPSVFHHEEPSPGVHTFTFTSAPTEAQAVGRVRVTHGAVPSFAWTDLQPQTPKPRIRLSGFAAPIAAPQPPRAISPRLEGTWTRKSGDYTTTVTYHDGRVSGSWQVTNGIEIRFSGACSVSRDDQFVGVIDEIEARGDDGEALQTHMLVQKLADQPFAARFVIDGDSLIIKDIRCSGISPTITDEKQSSELVTYLRTFAFGRFERSHE